MVSMQYAEVCRIMRVFREEARRERARARAPQHFRVPVMMPAIKMRVA